ncbi:MAG: M16 family metallopeptidase [Frankia sp.]
MTTTTTRTMPAVAPTRVPDLPTVVERTLGTGLRVLVVNRPAVPLVELRLRIPFAGSGAAFQATAALLAETLFTGTADRDRLSIAMALQALGGSLSTGVDADRFAIGGSALAINLEPFLGILAEVLRGAAYPSSEVAGERARLVDSTAVSRSQPTVVAREALLGRLYGDHPYASDVPLDGRLAEVTETELRTLHASRVSPEGAILTLVGAVDPEAALDAVEAALGGWTGSPSPSLPPVPAYRTGPIVIVDRPGAVQTNIRLGGPALNRDSPEYPAQRLATTIFGGYFSSRLVSNIREDKGYSYSPRAAVEHLDVVSQVTVAVDVATDVTAPALLEVMYEQGRIATRAVSQDELDAARQYAAGTLALSTATSAGLASTLSSLAGAGIGIEYLRDHPAALATVTIDEVLGVAASVLAPSRLTTVLLGDASVISSSVSTLGALEKSTPV